MVKKEPVKAAVPTVKDAKSDSSFFSAPKPKPKLPSFKKAPPTATPAKQDAANVAQPSSIDHFQEALKWMAKGRRGSPAVTTPVSSTTPPQYPPTVKNGKKKKTVSWPPEDKLESVRLIEKAIYDDDPVDVSLFLLRILYDTLMVFLRFLRLFSIQGYHVLHTLRELDRGEGAALHAHIFEETVDWSEPMCKQLIIWCYNEKSKELPFAKMA